ncbi:hypothetical protein D3C72_2071760 [compost metagenome]
MVAEVFFNQPVALSIAGLVGSKYTEAILPLVQFKSVGPPSLMVNDAGFAVAPAKLNSLALTVSKGTFRSTAPFGV